MSVDRTADGAVRLEGKTTVSRGAAGVGWNWLGLLGDDVMLHAQVTLTRATA